MLSLVQTFGLSHVCAKKEFENIESLVASFNYPYLDIHVSLNHSEATDDYYSQFNGSYTIEFYLRGTKDQELRFQNLFEYLLSIDTHGTEFKIM